jgi:hypothetical protein
MGAREPTFKSCVITFQLLKTASQDCIPPARAPGLHVCTTDVVALLWGWQCCYNLFASPQLLSEARSPRSSRKRSIGADEARERMQ